MRISLSRGVWVVVVLIIVLNIFLFYQRGDVISAPCDVPQAPDAGRGAGDSIAPRHAPSANVSDVNCTLNVPCRYPDVVDLRVIVITYNRAASLQTLLTSLDDLELDGDTASLEVWIDRGKKGQVDESLVELARAFSWSRGQTRVHVRDAHAGIYGQWIDTWRPPATNASSELCLILEDDLTVSPYAYRWLRAAHNQYGGRTDIAGYTLQSEGVNKAGGGGALKVSSTESAFLYLLVGSWGYAPHPARWRHFQDWYHTQSRNKTFKPYVPGLVMTNWYKSFETQGKADTMWTMWHIYFTNQKSHFTVYNNLRAFRGDSHSCLAVNRQEPGLHFGGKGKTETPCLLRTWTANVIKLPDTPIQYDLFGKTR